MASPSTIACYAKLVGPSHTVFYLTRPRATLGRKVPYLEGTLYESGEKVPIADFFVGSSPTISRIHCTLSYTVGNGRHLSRYEVLCCSKNGMWVDGVHITRESGPFVLRSRSLLLLGDVYWYFLLPRDVKPTEGLTRPPAVTYVSLPIITRSSRKDEEEREKEREQRRRKEREEREKLKPPIPPSTSPFPTSHSPTPTPKLLPPPPSDLWSRTEREVIKDLLLTFASSRLDLIHLHLTRDGVNKTPSEVEGFVVTFIAAVMNNVGGNMGKQLRSVSPASFGLIAVPASSPTPAPPPTPLLFTLLTWNLMTKSSKAWARRILQLHNLHMQMMSRGSLHTLDNLVKAPRGRLPAVWWSRECDVDLLIGIYRWGYGRFDEMREDKQLCFHRIMEQLKERRAHNDSIAAAHDDGPPPLDAADEDEDEEAGDEEDTEEDEEVDEEEDEDEGGGKKAKAKSSTSTPVASRPASPISRTLFGPVSKGKTEDGWPISLALVGRFRQLLKAMRLRDQDEGDALKRKATDSSRPGPPSKRLKKEEPAPGAWTEDELSLFHKLMLLIGVPLTPTTTRWNALRNVLPPNGQAVAVARKSNEALNAQLDASLKEAKSLLAPLNEKQMLEALHEKTLGVMAGLYNGPLLPTLPPTLTPLISSHLLSHLQCFHLGRTLLTSPPSTPPPALVVSPLSPSWWKVMTHDRYLVMAVNTHGLRLKEIDEDLAYPFKLYGGLEGHVRGVGVGKGMEWIVERWKTVVEFWAKEKEKETEKEKKGGVQGQTGSGIKVKQEEGGGRKKKEEGRKSGGSSQQPPSKDKSQRD